MLDPSLMALLKLNVIVLAAVFLPPLPVIIRVGLVSITDFTLGNTSINTNADTLNLSDLLIGYDSNSNLSDFITVVDEGANTKLISVVWFFWQLC
jgi:hypothetical protein